MKRSWWCAVLSAAFTGVMLTSITPLAEMIGVTGTASAAPSVEYQANEVAAFTDNHGRHAPFRRGYYDAVADQGFGYDKAVLKHNLRDIDVVRNVVANPESSGFEPGGGDRWYYRGPWQHRQCTKDKKCQVLEQVWVRVIIEFDKWNLAPQYGDVGVITAYCEGMERCPEWLNNLNAG